MYGKRIRELRKNADINQAELAEKVGVSRPNISFWENAEYPPLEAIYKICKVFEIEIWQFFVDNIKLGRIFNIPSEYIDLLQETQKLNPELSSDLFEIFKTILSKYQKLNNEYNVIPKQILNNQLDSDLLLAEPNRLDILYTKYVYFGMS